MYYIYIEILEDFLHIEKPPADIISERLKGDKNLIESNDVLHRPESYTIVFQNFHIFLGQMPDDAWLTFFVSIVYILQKMIRKLSYPNERFGFDFIQPGFKIKTQAHDFFFFLLGIQFPDDFLHTFLFSCKKLFFDSRNTILFTLHASNPFTKICKKRINKLYNFFRH